MVDDVGMTPSTPVRTLKSDDRITVMNPAGLPRPDPIDRLERASAPQAVVSIWSRAGRA
jgi:hypothetical protein